MGLDREGLGLVTLVMRDDNQHIQFSGKDMVGVYIFGHLPSIMITSRILLISSLPPPTNYVRS